MTLPRRLAIVDVETTGAHPVHDRLTEIAIVRVDDGVVVERWESLVNPGVPIPSMIQELVGITDAMVAEAPAFEVRSSMLWNRRLIPWTSLFVP